MTRRSRRYKTVNAFTKSLGHIGDQILIAYYDKIDAQGRSAYLHNVQVTYLASEEGGGTVTGSGSCMLYATTDDTWSDNYILTASAGGNVGAKVNLSVKRAIRTDGPTSAQTLGEGGPVYIWAESPDMTDGVDDVEFRFVLEAWHNGFVECTEV